MQAQRLTLPVDHFYPEMYIVLQKSLEELDRGAVHTCTLVSSQGEVGKWAAVFISGDRSLSRSLLQTLSELVWGSNHLFKLFLKATRRPDSASSMDTSLRICLGLCHLHTAMSPGILVWGERVYWPTPLPRLGLCGEVTSQRGLNTDVVSTPRKPIPPSSLLCFPP